MAKHLRIGLGTVWLLCIGAPLLTFASEPLSWQSHAGYRAAALKVPAGGKAGFFEMAPAVTGIAFSNVLNEYRGLTNQIYMSGSGVAAGDVDGDGWCDLYFCGIDSANVLYRNLGNWKFQDVTASAGPIACTNQASTGCALADVDGDRDLDLLVNALPGGTRLFLNDGKGKFAEATKESGLQGKTASLSMALADVDGDSDLDLYVTNYRINLLQDEPNTEINIVKTNNQPVITRVNGRTPTAEDLARFSIHPGSMNIIENGEADALYLNDGKGKFSALSWTNGAFLDEDGRPADAPLDWGLSVMFRDMNADGAPDIYVCNDMDSIDRIYINNGSARFQAIPRLTLRHTCLASMGVDFADINRDGLDDFFVVDMLAPDHRVRHTQLATRHTHYALARMDIRPQYMRNCFYLNRGDGTYTDIAHLAGLEASDWSWMPAFLDVDLDGYEDLLVTTGMEKSFRDADARYRLDRARGGKKKLSSKEFFDMRKSIPRLDNPNYAFRNRGDLTFEQVSAAWGFASRRISQGMAMADLDLDGDLDLAINCLNAPALLYRNETSAPRIAVRLKGAGGNAQGIGAKIKVTGGTVVQSQEVICAGRYLSSDDPVRVFAAGENLKIEVTWRNGTQSVLAGAKPNHLYEIEQPATANPPPAANLRAAPNPFFEDVSYIIRHYHHEEEFNDFSLQPMLPRRLSQLGPGVCWADFNGDGLDDLLVASGRSGEMGLFPNDGKGGFGRVGVIDFMGKLLDDQTTVLVWPSGPDARTISVGVANYENGNTNDPSVLHYELSSNGLKQAPSTPGYESSIGAMAVGDIDGDGDLDLFVGGRVIGARYPDAASSRIYRRGSALEFDVANSKALENAGLVSGAVFTDLDGDGFPELVLACEWGAIKVFRNQDGKLSDATTQWGLDKFNGWWNSVAAGDFNGDGLLDLVAGNWGRNTKYERYLARPVQVFFGGEGLIQLVEAHYEPTLKKVVPWKHWDAMGAVLPFVRQRYASFKAFSEAGVQEILGETYGGMQQLTAGTLESMVFLNRGTGFEAKPLPIEAQFSPVFGVSVADLDGDGAEDIFLTQNFFGVDPDTSRYDAGRGLWLRGKGDGTFTAVAGHESGILIYGEARGAAVSDYDGDGRVDLAAGQNGTETKLYRNTAGRPGLRVRLQAAGQNTVGAGTVIRPIVAGKMGPARESHIGSGYWSQDSTTQVLAGSPSKLWIRWPGGKTNIVDIPSGAKEVVVRYPDGVQAVR